MGRRLPASQSSPLRSGKDMVVKKQWNAGNEFWSLYGFADRVDIQLMVIGLVLALVQAVLLPFVWLVMGDFVSLSIVREV